jgi:hypothetical protein
MTNSARNTIGGGSAMTGKQIEKAKDELYFKYYGDECRIPENLKQPWTKEDEVLYEELSCREMINSILIYGGSCEKGGYKYERYLKPYIEGDLWHKTLLSEERVDELIKEQQDSLSRATISADVYTDSEGCTYNSCKWEDD